MIKYESFPLFPEPSNYCVMNPDTSRAESHRFWKGEYHHHIPSSLFFSGWCFKVHYVIPCVSEDFRFIQQTQQSSLRPAAAMVQSGLESTRCQTGVEAVCQAGGRTQKITVESRQSARRKLSAAGSSVSRFSCSSWWQWGRFLLADVLPVPVEVFCLLRYCTGTNRCSFVSQQVERNVCNAVVVGLIPSAYKQESVPTRLQLKCVFSSCTVWDLWGWIHSESNQLSLVPPRGTMKTFHA